jgi:hypothetical protein
VAVRANISFPSKPTGVERFDHEDDVAAFVRPLGEFLGFGTSPDGSTDVFIGVPDDEGVKAWAARMCDTLRAVGAPAGTSLAIFPEDDRKFWDREWWRVEVFGPCGEDGPPMMRMRNDWDAPDGFVELGYA